MCIFGHPQGGEGQSYVDARGQIGSQSHQCGPRPKIFGDPWGRLRDVISVFKGEIKTWQGLLFRVHVQEARAARCVHIILLSRYVMDIIRNYVLMSLLSKAVCVI